MGDSTIRAALRWLAHPVSLLAIGVMVLNDHVLKQAYGTWWTGKVSDVAGLVFFPALVAVALAAVRPKLAAVRPKLAAVRPPLAAVRPKLAAHVQTRGTFERLTVAAVVVTGIGFAWVKATAVGAATASTVLTGITGPLFGGSSIVRADATDLLALPALGLAVWVARRVVTQGERRVKGTGRRSAGRRAFAVAMVPLAILASVATTSPSYPRVSVVDDGHRGWVALAGDWDNHAYRLTADGWKPAVAPEEPFVPVPKACSRVQPDWCFRTVAGELAVQQSSDGGATWETAWAASTDDRRAMADAYGVGWASSSAIVSSGVGVFDGADGFTVVVGNGYDGLLVRGIDGTWERAGFEALGCCSSSAPVALPTRWTPYGAAIPPAIAWGFAVLTVLSAASLVVAHGRLRRWRSREGSAREWTAHVLVWAGALAAAAAAIGVGPTGSSTGDGVMYVEVRVGFYVLELIVAFVLAVIAFSLARGRTLRGRWQLTSFSLAASLTVGVLVLAVPGAGWWDALVALPLCVAAVWVASGWITSHAERLAVTPFLQHVKPTHLERGELVAAVARTMSALAPEKVEPTEEQSPAIWTPKDALLLTCIGPGWIAGDVRAVLVEAKAIDDSYPSLAELEEGIGRLEASGLVKVVRPDRFRVTRRGRAVLRAGGLSSTGFLAQAGSDLSVHDALRDVECQPGRMRIGRDAYERALTRAFGL